MERSNKSKKKKIYSINAIAEENKSSERLEMVRSDDQERKILLKLSIFLLGIRYTMT